jgi:phosphonate ABC transporter permease subunit PhnE
MLKQNKILRSFLLGLAIFLALIIYAYGFEVTKVNLDETRDPRRQSQLTRILRALARPDIITYEKDEFAVSLPVYIPCPESGAAVLEPDKSGPYLVMDPPCADPATLVTIEGFNFEPNTNGPLNFIPPSGVSLQMGTIKADAQGHFVAKAKLPKRPDTVAQEIRAITRRNVGGPQLSQNAINTWEKIIETVFLALLATTFGVLIAIPVSFIAARNIMTPITSPFTSVALSILFLPAGLLIGAYAAARVSDLGRLLTASIAANLTSLVLAPALMLATFRWAMPPVEQARPSPVVRISRPIVLFLTALLAVLFLYLLSGLAIRLGDALAGPLGRLGFLGEFLGSLGDILAFLIPVLSGLAGAGFLGGLAGKLGQLIVEHTSQPVNRALNLVLGALAGATLFALIGAGIDWLYQVNNLASTLTIPAVLGTAVGVATAAALARNSVLPIGFVVYSITRTILNGLRSIESLVMVIIFAVWVGIGPFAGVLALALHTIASNAKLYSEQVEGIMAGPLEAITATGANRLQTIVYAVIPQIIPPYISYTMYRWDINVRMSTIIGFAGGGGIGFLLQQNINLLNYRAASTQMLAIAVVVASMDYLSSKMREKVI